MARRQQVNTNIRTGQGLSTNVVAGGQGPIEVQADMSRADRFLTQLSTATDALNMVVGAAQAKQKQSAEALLAEEEAKKSQLEYETKLEERKQELIKSEIAIKEQEWKAEERYKKLDEEAKKAREEKLALIKGEQSRLLSKSMFGNNYENVAQILSEVNANVPEEVDAPERINAIALNSQVANRETKEVVELVKNQIDAEIANGAQISTAEQSQRIQAAVMTRLSQAGVDLNLLDQETYDSVGQYIFDGVDYALGKEVSQIASETKERNDLQKEFALTDSHNRVADSYTPGAEDSVDAIANALQNEAARLESQGYSPSEISKKLLPAAEKFIKDDRTSAQQRNDFVQLIETSQVASVGQMTSSLRVSIPTGGESEAYSLAKTELSEWMSVYDTPEGSAKISEIIENPELTISEKEDLKKFARNKKTSIDASNNVKVVEEHKSLTNVFNGSTDPKDIQVANKVLKEKRDGITFTGNTPQDQLKSAMAYVTKVNSFPNSVNFAGEGAFNITKSLNIEDEAGFTTGVELRNVVMKMEVDDAIKQRLLNEDPKLRKISDALNVAESINMDPWDYLNKKKENDKTEINQIVSQLSSRGAGLVTNAVNDIQANGIDIPWSFDDIEAEDITSDMMRDLSEELYRVQFMTNESLTKQDIIEIASRKFTASAIDSVNGVSASSFGIKKEDLRNLNEFTPLMANVVAAIEFNRTGGDYGSMVSKANTNLEGSVSRIIKVGDDSYSIIKYDSQGEQIAVTDPFNSMEAKRGISIAKRNASNGNISTITKLTSGIEMSAADKARMFMPGVAIYDYFTKDY